MSQEQTFYDKANKLADTIKAKANALRAILSEYQTHETTDYEIERSIRTLRNLSEISSHLNHQTDSVASVLPSNLPLYSLILFAVMPAAIAEEVNIRPNTLLQQHAVVSRLSDALGLKELFPAIHIRDVDHEGFRPYLHKSDAVIFTGNPAHAQNILAEMKEGALLISNGSGHNPLVVTNSADIDKVVEAA
jgi:acyl-CoA reductase-like NAD-dependent aldehyde dehydrogenase